MRSETDIRNNTAIELFRIDKKPINIRALSANKADEWLERFGEAFKKLELSLSRISVSRANLSTDIINDKIDDAAKAVAEIKMSALALEQRESERRMVSVLREAILYYLTLDLGDLFIQENKIEAELENLSYAQLRLSFSILIGLVDPLLVNGLVNMAMFRGLQNQDTKTKP